MRQGSRWNHRPSLTLVRKPAQTQKAAAVAVVVFHCGHNTPARIHRIDFIVESQGMAYGYKVSLVCLPVVIGKTVFSKGHVPDVTAVARYVEICLCVSADVTAVVHRAGIIDRIGTDSDIDICQQVPDRIYRAVPVRILVAGRRGRANLSLQVFRDIEDNRCRIDRAVGHIIFRRQSVRGGSKTAVAECRQDGVAVAYFQACHFHSF